MRSINGLCKEAHETAIKSGFYKNDDKIETMQIFAIDGHKTADEVKSYIKSMRICQLLLLTISELTEAMEADRKYNHAFDTWVKNSQIKKVNALKSDVEFKKAYLGWIKDNFPDELAGACIRIFDICGFLKIDLESHIVAAMRYNKLSQPKHGKKY